MTCWFFRVTTIPPKTIFPGLAWLLQRDDWWHESDEGSWHIAVCRRCHEGMHGEVDDILVTYKEEQWRKCSQILQKGFFSFFIFYTYQMIKYVDIKYRFELKMNVSFHLYIIIKLPLRKNSPIGFNKTNTVKIRSHFKTERHLVTEMQDGTCCVWVKHLGLSPQCDTRHESGAEERSLLIATAKWIVRFSSLELNIPESYVQNFNKGEVTFFVLWIFFYFFFFLQAKFKWNPQYL